MKRVLVFIGTRPEAIKMASVFHALKAAPDFEPVVVSTGQHREMLRQVTELFEIEVAHDLDVMQPNQTLAGLTARLLTAIDELLVRLSPDIALVQGDTTTVLSAALACFYRQIPLGHVEAGLRTHDLRAPFPEEANRVLAGRYLRDRQHRDRRVANGGRSAAASRRKRADRLGARRTIGC